MLGWAGRENDCYFCHGRLLLVLVLRACDSLRSGLLQSGALDLLACAAHWP